MLEKFGNMLETNCEALVITTNGFRKRNGECVMGRGIAKQIADAVPTLPQRLGELIGAHGNVVHYLGDHQGIALVSFPVKPISAPCKADRSNVVKHMRARFKEGDSVPGWACIADIHIITQSLKELKALTDEQGWTDVLCPRFGCGAGELDWETLKPTVEQHLDERFTCMTFQPV